MLKLLWHRYIYTLLTALLIKITLEKTRMTLYSIMLLGLTVIFLRMYSYTIKRKNKAIRSNYHLLLTEETITQYLKQNTEFFTFLSKGETCFLAQAFLSKA